MCFNHGQIPIETETNSYNTTEVSVVYGGRTKIQNGNYINVYIEINKQINCLSYLIHLRIKENPCKIAIGLIELFLFILFTDGI